MTEWCEVLDCDNKAVGYAELDEGNLFLCESCRSAFFLGVMMAATCDVKGFIRDDEDEYEQYYRIIGGSTGEAIGWCTESAIEGVKAEEPGATFVAITYEDYLSESKAEEDEDE